jgi:putative restriction endonuclease
LVRDITMSDVVEERARRLHLWQSLSNGPLDDLEPQQLRDLGIYGGAQGIWVDKARTSSPEIGANGATVAILHTGRHYADDLSDDGLIYHYPRTSRSPGRDVAEIQATKNAMIHGLPIFVILPGKISQSRRCLKLGWVCDFDDENRQFLVLFGQEAPPTYSPAEADDEPFHLTEGLRRRRTTAMARPGQQRFRFHVLAKYGHKCAVCDIRHPMLLKAAHICGKAYRGSDDWRNGVPLCATHHDAFDNHLFCIEPKTGMIQCKPGLVPAEMGLRELRLQPSKNAPHMEALQWRWESTQKEWKHEFD